MKKVICECGNDKWIILKKGGNKMKEYDKIRKRNNEWVGKIPIIPFKKDWQIELNPPFNGALVRFNVMKNGKSISVFLDVDDSLGCMNEPYWEIYPYYQDTQRFLLYQVSDLVKAIDLELNRSDDYDKIKNVMEDNDFGYEESYKNIEIANNKATFYLDKQKCTVTLYFKEGEPK